MVWINIHAYDSKIVLDNLLARCFKRYSDEKDFQRTARREIESRRFMERKSNRRHCRDP
jgi:hypothetical protein